MPREYPLAFFEMSLPPAALPEGRARQARVYFTRVYNPVWTNPDGLSWMEVLKDEAKIGLHAALTPIWSETAWFADYVLPMGLGPERHDLMSQETHAARWIGFRQPVLRVRAASGRAASSSGRCRRTRRRAGEVWEEDEFWIELSWRIDPDGALGIRKYFESPYRPGEKLTDRGVLPLDLRELRARPARGRAEEGLTPLEYMRKYGAFLIEDGVYETHDKPVRRRTSRGSPSTPSRRLVERGRARRSASRSTASRARGFPTPSRKLEFFSPTLEDWKWPEQALPGYVRSQVHRSNLDRDAGRVGALADLPAAHADPHALRQLPSG